MKTKLKEKIKRDLTKAGLTNQQGVKQWISTMEQGGHSDEIIKLMHDSFLSLKPTTQLLAKIGSTDPKACEYTISAITLGLLSSLPNERRFAAINDLYTNVLRSLGIPIDDLVKEAEGMISEKTKVKKHEDSVAYR